MKNSSFLFGKTQNINSAYYCNEFLSLLLLKIKKKSEFVFMQNRAPYYTSKETTAFLSANYQALIKPNNWHSCTSDLNTITYSVQSALEKKFYHGAKI